MPKNNLKIQIIDPNLDSAVVKAKTSRASEFTRSIQNSISPKTAALAIAFLSLASQIKSALAQNAVLTGGGALVDGWKNAIYKLPGNTRDIAIQLDPQIFTNATETFNRITLACKGILEPASSNWWDDTSISWDQLMHFPLNGAYRLQAQVIGTYLDWLNANTPPSNIANCVTPILEPQTHQEFYNDWTTSLQILFIVGMVCSAACYLGSVTGCAYALFKKPKNGTETANTLEGSHLLAIQEGTPVPPPTYGTN